MGDLDYPTLQLIQLHDFLSRCSTYFHIAPCPSVYDLAVFSPLKVVSNSNWPLGLHNKISGGTPFIYCNYWPIQLEEKTIL